MPVYDEDVDLTKKNTKPCSGVRDDLLLCLKASDCVKVVSSISLKMYCVNSKGTLKIVTLQFVRN